MLTNQELCEHGVFKVTDNDISMAYRRARSYGQLMVDMRFARRYYIIADESNVHCFPTNESSNMLAFMNFLKDKNKI